MSYTHDDILMPLAITVVIDQKVRTPELRSFTQQATGLIELFELDPKQKLPTDDQFTGAEIRSCCRLAALLDIPLVQSAINVVPVAVTANESVDALRNWASGRCLDSEAGGIYQFKKPKARARRKVKVDPSLN